MDHSFRHKEHLAAHTPRSGISSLGLASPPRDLYQAVQRGTGGEALGPPPPAASDNNAAAAAAAASASSASWEMVNQLLRQEGYRTASGRDEPGEVLAVLKQVLRDRRELGDLLKNYQTERQRWDSDQRLVEGRLQGVERARGSLNETLHAAENRAKDLEAELERTRRECQEQVREAKVKATQLAGCLRQSEHRVKMRDVHIDKLNAKMEALVAREGKEKERQKAVFRKLQGRDPRASDAKLLEAVGALESARARAVESAKALKDEVRALNETVKEKDNYILEKERSGAWQVGGGGGAHAATTTRKDASGPLTRSNSSNRGSNAAVGSGHGVQQLLEKIRELEKASRLGSRREQGLAQKVEALEEAKKALQAQAERLEEEKQKLKEDLKSCPTAKAWKASQKQVEGLQKAVREDAVAAAAAAASMGSSTARRNSTGRSSSSSTKEMVGELCRLLELSDPAQIGPAVARLTEAMAAIPSLEAFVKDVCGFLARATLPHGQHLSPKEALRRMPMDEARRVLREWAKEVQGNREVRRLRSRLRTILSNRDAQALQREHEEEEEEEEEAGEA